MNNTNNILLVLLLSILASASETDLNTNTNFLILLLLILTALDNSTNNSMCGLNPCNCMNCSFWCIDKNILVIGK